MKAVKNGSPLVGIEAKTGVYPGMAGVDRLKLMGIERGEGERRSRGRVLGRGHEAHCYHVMSRTCGGEIWLDDVEKEALVKLLGKMSRFCGVELLTYCVMGNHFHALVRVPDKETWMRQFEGAAGEERLLGHLGRFYSRGFVEALRWQLSEDRRLGDEVGAQARLQGFKDRLCDLSQFMQEVKTRFTKWYNKRHGRRGTLWMERFKSVLVEGSRKKKEGLDALRVMALYIDLNPVRAGLVEDPVAYRWCGYAAAMGGEKAMRWGLTEVVGQRSWKRTAEVYRMWLVEGARGEEKKGVEAENEEGRQSGKRVRHGVSLEKRVEVLKKRGGMSVGELLRCRVRYFSDGAVIGSREFVGEHRRRGEDDERRVPKVKELAAGLELHTMRGLRVDAVRRKGGG